MAEDSSISETPEAEISALKEAIRVQKQLLQKLYADLEEERESSATAASEALAMILRLQGEKAAVKMEANQYKRIAEEKMFHAEESLAIFEDVIYQKEMEIASLGFQVQAYRCKLLSTGILSEQGLCENVYPETLLRNELVVNGETGKVRRMKSLPPIQLKDPYSKKSDIESEKSVVSLSDFLSKIVEQSVNPEKNCDEKVKQIPDSKVHENPETKEANLVQDIFEIPTKEKKDEMGLKVGERVKVKNNSEKKLAKARKRESFECNPGSVCSRASVAKSEFEIQELYSRIERLEKMRDCERGEISEEGGKEEELKLLKDIHEKLDLIQSEMRSWRSKKLLSSSPSPSSSSSSTSSSHKDEITTISITEAMLHFWL